MSALPLPTLAGIRDAVLPQASALLPTIPFTPDSSVMLLAIGLQESRFRHRRQVKGPARGFWQFEAGGGTKGVLTHPRTHTIARSLAWERVGTASITTTINEALAEDDVLACCFARLLLWTDPKPLPGIGDREEAWRYYFRNWRPGTPHRKTWDALYDQAVKLLTEQI